MELVVTETMSKIFYDVSYIMNTLENFGDFKVKKNVSLTKDVFKLKYPYDESFWKTQNQLLLTNEMRLFIKEANKSEFRVSNNIK